ncbi:MAG: hypothetical protein ACE1ZA_17635 [Pseudomonadales bacterium]
MSEVTDQKPTGPRRGIGVLAESLNKDLRLVSEEVVGAEILATKEVIENIGIFLDTLERLDNIRVEQVRWFFEDFATTYKRFAQSQDFPYVVTDHCQRRLEHVADGFQQVSQAVTREISIFEQILFSLWKPFFAVVERDWKGVR